MLEEIVPLEPIHFFAFQIDCHYAKGSKLGSKHVLPDLSLFYHERPFAAAFIGWHEAGIYASIHIEGRFDQSNFPNFTSADSIEFFIDTRDIKTSGYTTRFCHHFYFLPDPIQTNGEQVQAGEVTRFRTDDIHELCDASLLKVNTSQEKRGRSVQIFIPSECLHGYDPTQFNRLGFTFRLNRINGSRQYFSASSADFSIENQPALWASLKLIR